MANDTELQALIRAITEQESGGDYSATNGQAVGRYQVLKSNVPSWTQQYLGHAMTWQEFLHDPAAQDQVAAAKIGEYYRSYGVRGAAAAWYSGDASLADSTRPQAGGPSIKSYVDQVVARMGAAPAGSSNGSGTVESSSYTNLFSLPGEIISFFSRATDDLTGAADFARAFFRPGTYVRIGAGALGTVLVIAGLVFLAKEAKD